MNIYFKKTQQNSNKPNKTIYKRIIHNVQVEFILGMQDWLKIWKLINTAYHINKIKHKSLSSSQ